MVNCENCYHYEMCDKWRIDPEMYYSKVIDSCDDFKDKDLIIELPCKVGSTIYFIDDGEIYWGRVNDIEIRKEDNELIFYIAFMNFKKEDFGETVFLTKEEAEAKLKELNNKQCL